MFPPKERCSCWQKKGCREKKRGGVSTSLTITNLFLSCASDAICYIKKKKIVSEIILVIQYQNSNIKGGRPKTPLLSSKNSGHKHRKPLFSFLQSCVEWRYYMISVSIVTETSFILTALHERGRYSGLIFSREEEISRNSVTWGNIVSSGVETSIYNF